MHMAVVWPLYMTVIYENLGAGSDPALVHDRRRTERARFLLRLAAHDARREVIGSGRYMTVITPAHYGERPQAGSTSEASARGGGHQL